jgi:hypothetical protein
MNLLCIHHVHPVDSIPIPNIKKYLGVLHCMIMDHETDTFSYPLYSFVSTFGCTSVHSSNTIIKSHSIACKTCFTTSSVIMSMHFINEESCMLKIACFTDKAVWCNLTGKVINDDFGCNRESGVDCRKYIISTFCNWDRMKAKTDGVCAPKHKDATSELILGISLVKLVAVTHFFCIPIKCMIVIPKF